MRALPQTSSLQPDAAGRGPLRFEKEPHFHELGERHLTERVTP